VEPDYPPLLKKQGIEGDVVLLVIIDTQGKVSSAKVVKPSPHASFNDAALAAARRTRYAPATRGGKPMVFSQRYTVRFRIHD
jgi:protein TonB